MIMNRRQFIGHTAALAAAGLGPRLFADSSENAESWKKTLAGHRLSSLDIQTVQLNWPRLVGKNSRLDVHGRGVRETICRIRTDQGASGWGPFLADPRRAEEILPPFKGMPVSELFDPAVGILRPEARPLDFALHDLAGIILNIPVYRMLGSQGPQANPCYSGMIYFDDLEPPDNPAGIDRVLQNCRQDIDFGYRQLKVKIGRGNRWMEKEAGLRRDIEVTKKIAEAFPGIAILVDGNDGFTCEEFLRYLEGIGDVDLFWIEEPFRETREDYEKLRAWLEKNKKKTLLADGEANPEHALIMELLRDGLLDVNLYDVCGYGLTQWRALMGQLKKMGALASPHAWGSALKTNYVAHLAAGLGNVVTIEGVTCTSEQVDLGRYELRDGKLVTSSAPGFGMTLKIG
ncbi:MAG TPA: enolase C-terminal domain-like protein [Anaerohalosphaeraceae bacterium]|nr:enolase C-terminal domain-like protein [Anaerohalosphaeraceae bacterium]HPP55686.1 enolase C-terminal domain-like protein [Anaerohalosphaeraceae bacterium]